MVPENKPIWGPETMWKKPVETESENAHTRDPSAVSEFNLFTGSCGNEGYVFRGLDLTQQVRDREPRTPGFHLRRSRDTGTANRSCLRYECRWTGDCCLISCVEKALQQLWSRTGAIRWGHLPWAEEGWCWVQPSIWHTCKKLRKMVLSTQDVCHYKIANVYF